MNRDYSSFIRRTEDLGLTLSEAQISGFDTFYQMLIEKNKIMNLTGITEFEEVIEKHFLDSLAVVTLSEFQEANTVLDLGTGAGFPGIPLAISFPDKNFTLVDSLNKRILFLQEVVDALKLQNVTLIHGRAEELARNKGHRECYDVVVSRAVANLATLSEYCLPFVSLNGFFISYKSGDIDLELEDSKRGIFMLGGKVSKVNKFVLAETDLSRSFVLIQKEKKTGKAYPRKAGTPSKSPLGIGPIEKK